MAKNHIFLTILFLALIIFLSYKTYEGFQIVNCSKLTDCKGCANSFGCVWCAKSNKCVDDLSSNSMCAGESTVTNPLGCNVASESGTMLSPKIHGQCSSSTSCSSCLSTPDCFWCSNQKACVSNMNVYKQCASDNILNSFSQCELTSSGSTPTSTSTSTSYSGTSVIPITGLSRSTDGSLTQASINTIVQSLAAGGNPITTADEKTAALNLVNSEEDFYKNQYKTAIGSYLGETVVDFKDDPAALAKVQAMQTHIQDLKDISRYINAINVSMFMEGFQVDFDTIKTAYNNESIKNTLVGYKIQIFLLANLVALGSLFFL